MSEPTQSPYGGFDHRPPAGPVAPAWTAPGIPSPYGGAAPQAPGHPDAHGVAYGRPEPGARVPPIFGPAGSPATFDPPSAGYPQLGAPGHAGMAPGGYPPPVPYRSVPALPTEPRRYTQLFRGPRYRWWKPLLSLLLALLFALTLMLGASVVVVIAGLVNGARDLPNYVLQQTTDIKAMGPVGFLYLNLSLIVLIPSAMFANWIVHGIRPRFVTSVAGGIRWRWLLRCVAVVLPVWVIYIGGSILSEPPTGTKPPQWVALMVLVVVLTPLQAAGEEYFFRGWILQNVGAWFRRPVLGLVVCLVISAVAFSAAHGSPDPWVLGSIACLAVAAGLAAWWTGGLEAGIVMHATNNVLTFFVVLNVGGWDQAFVGSDTKSSPLALIVAIAVHGLALALIVWQARRARIEPLYQPAVATPAITPPPAVAAAAPPAA